MLVERGEQEVDGTARAGSEDGGEQGGVAAEAVIVGDEVEGLAERVGQEGVSDDGVRDDAFVESEGDEGWLRAPEEFEPTGGDECVGSVGFGAEVGVGEAGGEEGVGGFGVECGEGFGGGLLVEFEEACGCGGEEAVGGCGGEGACGEDAAEALETVG